VICEEIGELHPGDGGPFLLVRVLESMTFEGEVVEFLALSPRHHGVDLDTIRRGPSTTVAIARIRAGMLESAKAEIAPDNFQVIAVGGATLISPNQLPWPTA
jgi:hypothetical protein